MIYNQLVHNIVDDIVRDNKGLMDTPLPVINIHWEKPNWWLDTINGSYTNKFKLVANITKKSKKY